MIAEQPIRRRMIVTLTTFGLLLAVALVTAPLLGSTSISLARVFDRAVPFADNTDAQIFFIARLPLVLAAAIVGASLAAAGVVFQALLRNPLATPDTLGVSSGAALGAMLAITFHLDFTFAGIPTMPLASFAGSLGALGIVYALATARRRGLSTIVLLLAGVTMTAFFQALIMFTQYVADFTDTYRTVRWLMGTLDVASYAPILAVLPIIVIAFAMLATLPRSLDLISLGADAAAAGGVNVLSGEGAGLTSAWLAHGARVAGQPGPVHRSRRAAPRPAGGRLGSPACCRHRRSSARRSDRLRRGGARCGSQGAPVGIVTALIGGPFFLWLLVRK
jgi:iron complex transport system permease protein